LTFYATDGTTEAQMFCFDGVARQIIEKPRELLIRSMNTSANTPLDLHRIIGLRFTFVVNININSSYSKEIIFNVSSIIEAHSRQQTISHTQTNIEDEDPLKSDELSPPLPMQESPATTMKILSTGTRTFSVSISFYASLRYKKLTIDKKI
jgi:hypothetical protein